VRSCSPNFVTPTPITATRRMKALLRRMLALNVVTRSLPEAVDEAGRVQFFLL